MSDIATKIKDVYVCACVMHNCLFVYFRSLETSKIGDNGFAVPDSSSPVSFHKAKFGSVLGYNIITQDQCTHPKKSQGMLSALGKQFFGICHCNLQ